MFSKAQTLLRNIFYPIFNLKLTKSLFLALLFTILICQADIFVLNQVMHCLILWLYNP